MTASATQRHGWGTGRAWMTPGRSPVSRSVTGSAVTGSARSRDAAALHGVLLQGRIVGAVGLGGLEASTIRLAKSVWSFGMT